MQEQIERLERVNRLLILAGVALVAFVLGTLTSGGGSALTLPRADAQPELKTYDALSDRPLIIFTSSDSGSTLYEFRRQKNGAYARQIWAK